MQQRSRSKTIIPNNRDQLWNHSTCERINQRTVPWSNYDSRYNVSQVKATNHLGGTDVTCTSYSYTGKPLSVRIQDTRTGTALTEENLSYTYDDADRMVSGTFSVTHGGPEGSSSITYEYDALGRLSKETRPITSVATPDVSYAYDLHGWMKSITTNSFCEELFYADGPGTHCWSGNISSMRWTGKKSTQKRGYKLSYDDANRLIQGVYGEGDALTSNTGRFSESVGYDAHGNVTRIIRNGKISSTGYGLMDDLTVTYDGNRLTGVTEAAADYDATGTFEYKGANGSEYLYDSNGSLIADRSRRIGHVIYDANGNPLRIQFTNGSVTKYVYSATGEKLRAIHQTAIPNISVPVGRTRELAFYEVQYADSTDYLLGGSLTLKNGRIDKCLFDGGYARAIQTSATTDRFVFYYYNKDHLGNNRELETSTGTIYQVTDYYPFGAPYADPDAVLSADRQPYKYNGKELDRMHGLDTYDYGARQYYSILGRWDRMDPLCEKYYSLSPYNYCGGNPVNAIDIEGKRGVRIINNQDQTVTIKAVYYVETGFRLGGTRSNPITLQQYSIDDIMKMQSSINGYLNGLGLTVKEGDYSGYKIMFDLSFKDGGDQISASQKADSENYEGYDIGNTIFRLNSEMHNLFKPMGNGDLKKVRGAVTQGNKDIAMNMEFDNTQNRVHEIFHTFGFSDDESGNGAQHGIMHYPPLDPDEDDVSTLMNIPYLPTIINQ